MLASYIILTHLTITRKNQHFLVFRKYICKHLIPLKAALKEYSVIDYSKSLS